MAQKEAYPYEVHPIISNLLDDGVSNNAFKQFLNNYATGKTEAIQEALRIGRKYKDFMPLGIWEDGEADVKQYIVEIITDYLEAEKCIKNQL